MQGSIRLMSVLSIYFFRAGVFRHYRDHWDSASIIFTKLLAIAVLVVLNGFFVACEFAIVKVRASQLDDAGGGREHARHFWSSTCRAHLDAYLSATQLGHDAGQPRLWAGSANHFWRRCSSRSSRLFNIQSHALFPRSRSRSPLARSLFCISSSASSRPKIHRDHESAADVALASFGRSAVSISSSNPPSGFLNKSSNFVLKNFCGSNRRPRRARAQRGGIAPHSRSKRKVGRSLVARPRLAR